MVEDRTRSAVALAAGLASGIVVGRIGLIGAQLTRLMLYGRRQPPWQIPHDLGLPAASVEFTAEDGVGLRGWLIPAHADRPAPAIVFVHGWPWNRCGNLAGQTCIPDATVDLLGPARALVDAGYHVLLFDLRNHGQSDARPPVTFGLHEARDLRAAVAFLRARADVDRERIGLVGYSMGANTVLYALPDIQPIPAAVVVQPVRVGRFAQRFSAAVIGPAGPLLLRLAEPLYQALGGPALDSIDPTGVAALAGDTRLLFVQGDGDPWGSAEETRAMVDAAPHASLELVPSSDRYAGYQYVGEQGDRIAGFFKEAFA
jgi:pimeloyl-ACP methyl ester carboxylesterase